MGEFLGTDIWLLKYLPDIPKTMTQNIYMTLTLFIVIDLIYFGQIKMQKMKNQDHEGKEACKKHLALLSEGNQYHPPDLHDFKDHQSLAGMAERRQEEDEGRSVTKVKLGSQTNYYQDEEVLAESSRKWLDLTLRRENSSSSHSLQSPRMVFSCNFCTRKFLSSQALGGHQMIKMLLNPKRGAKRDWQAKRMMILSLTLGSSLFQPCSAVQKLNTEACSAMEASLPNVKMMTLTWGSFNQGTTSSSLTWPGNLQINSQASNQPSELHKLDLNLHL